MTSSEFVMWMDYLEDEVNDFHREDYYLAQIAAAVERQYAKDPGAITTERKLITFKTVTTEPKALSNDDRIQNSKNFWLGLVEA